MQKLIQNLKEAEATIRAADHMIYVTYQLVKDKKILLRMLLNIKDATTKCINIILQHDYIYKKVKLYNDTKLNFREFETKSAPRCSINSNDIALIKELFQISEAHKTSPMEFIKEDKLVILSHDMKPTTITFEKTKEFLNVAKKLLSKTQAKIFN